MNIDKTFYGEFVADMYKDSPTEDDIAEYPVVYGMLHAAVGLAGEAGEVLDVIKKVVFVGKFFDRKTLVKELGDVEFYLQAIRNATDISRDEVLVENIKKLESRHPDGFKSSTFYKDNT